MGVTAKRLVTSLFALLASLIALEIGIRAYQRIVPGHSTGAQFSTFDPHLGWRHRPGTEGVFRGADFETRVKIDRLGLRGEEVQAGKPPPGTVRILFLGDSVTAGFEVGERETFAARVQDALNKCSGGGVRFEAINAGVRGYGTDQSLLYYEREGKKLGASLVVYTLVQNDIYENTRRVGLGGYYPKPRFRLDGNRLALDAGSLRPAQPTVKGTLSAVHRFLWLHSRVYGWTTGALSRTGQRGPEWIRRIFPEYTSSETPLTRRRTALFRALLERLLKDVRAEGARLIVQLNSTDFELNRTRLVRLFSQRIDKDVIETSSLNPDAFHDKYRRIAQSLGIPEVETLPAFRKAVAGGEWPFTSDGHPNAAGHSIMARSLLKKILSDGLLPLPAAAVERCQSYAAERFRPAGLPPRTG